MSKHYRFGLLGHNIGYSKSGDVFRAIFDISEVRGSFDLLDLSPRSFGKDFKSIAFREIDGLSVTIPFKQRVLDYLDDIHPVAQALEAVNSIAVTAGRLSGFNTDCHGFSRPLRGYCDRLKHGHALVLGCGGGAKAAVYALYTDYEVRHFTVMSRTKIRLKRFRQSLASHIVNIAIDTVHISDTEFEHPEAYDIIVNCTPLGGPNLPDTPVLPEPLAWSCSRLYYDLNYNPGNSAVASARERGLTVIDGSAMLIGQALRSLEIWTGETVDFDAVYDAVFGQKADGRD